MQMFVMQNSSLEPLVCDLYFHFFYFHMIYRFRAQEEHGTPAVLIASWPLDWEHWEQVGP